MNSILRQKFLTQDNLKFVLDDNLIYNNDEYVEICMMKFALWADAKFFFIFYILSSKSFNRWCWCWFDSNFQTKAFNKLKKISHLSKNFTDNLKTLTE